MIIFKSSNTLNKLYFYRLLDTSKYWIIFSVFFLTLFLILGINIKVYLGVMSPILFIFLSVSVYRSIYYIDKIVIEDELVIISYYKFSKINVKEVNLKDIKLEKIRDALTYHRHYKMLILLNNENLKQFNVLDWTYNKMDEMVEKFNELKK